MIKALINMLKAVDSFFSTKKENNIFSKIIESLIFLGLMFLICMFFYVFFEEILYRSFSIYFTFNFVVMGIFFVCLSIGLLFWILQKKNINKYFYQIIVPSFIFVFILMLCCQENFETPLDNLIKFFAFIFPLLFIGIYPISVGLQWVVRYFKKRTEENDWKIVKYGAYYNLVVSFFAFIFVLFHFFIEGIASELVEIDGIMFFLFIFLITTPWFVLKSYTEELGIVFFEDTPFKKIFYGFLKTAIIFITVISTAMWGVFEYQDQVEEARDLLSIEGENYEGFSQAKDLWFLESAIFSEYSSVYGSEKKSLKNLYEKIFDKNFEKTFANKLKNEESRSSFATSGVDTGENAKVLLSVAKYESSFISEISAIETVVTYTFQNTTNSSQEVVLDFMLPKEESVIIDLKLGKNLELQGQVAPRGAAAKVYEESLRKNIDPALLQKTGIRSYKLRVFPIPSKSNNATQGFQKVQFSYLTPLSENNANSQKVILAPALKTLNLRLHDETEVIVKLRNKMQLIENFSESGVDSTFFEKDYSVEFTENVSSQNLCKIYQISQLFNEKEEEEVVVLEKYKEEEEVVVLEKDKIIVFFDISSGAESVLVKNIYLAIEKLLHQYNAEILTYNYEVYEKATLDDVKFWGYTDSKSVTEYISKNNITNAHIIMLTDDDDFEKAGYGKNLTETKNVNYAKIAKNSFSVIQIGNSPASYRNEITNALLASSGHLYTVNTIEESEKVFNSILSTSSSSVAVAGNICEEISNKYIQKKWYQLDAHAKGKLFFAEIENEKDWNLAAKKQNILAEKYGIVNHFNSMIALATKDQQHDLERYSKSSDKFESTYENHINTSPRKKSRSSIGGTENPFGLDVRVKVDAASESDSIFNIGFGRDESNYFEDIDYSNRTGFFLDAEFLDWLYRIFTVIWLVTSGVNITRRESLKRNMVEKEGDKKSSIVFQIVFHVIYGLLILFLLLLLFFM